VVFNLSKENFGFLNDSAFWSRAKEWFLALSKQIRAWQASPKSKTVAALLALFVGSFGVHRFYLGQAGLGLIYLLFCWTFIPGLVAFIEFILLLGMSEEKFNQKYNA
jgi:TM2 domain-containing membrane protein YozV